MEYRKHQQNKVVPNPKIQKEGEQQRDIYIEIILLACTSGGFSVFNVYYWFFNH